jgi:hypothetical protein
MARHGCDLAKKANSNFEIARHRRAGRGPSRGRGPVVVILLMDQDTRLVPISGHQMSTRPSPSRPWSASYTTTSSRPCSTVTTAASEDTYMVIVTAMIITFPSVPDGRQRPGTWS